MKKWYTYSIFLIIPIATSFFVHGMYTSYRSALRRVNNSVQKPSASYSLPRTQLQSTTGGGWYSRLFSSSFNASNNKSPNGSWWSSVASFVPFTNAHLASSKYDQIKKNISRGVLPTYNDVMDYEKVIAESNYKVDFNEIINPALLLLFMQWNNEWDARNDRSFNESRKYSDSFYSRFLGVEKLFNHIDMHLNDRYKQEIKNFIIQFNSRISANESLQNLQEVAQFYNSLARLINNTKQAHMSFLIESHVEVKKMVHFLATNLDDLGNCTVNEIRKSLKEKEPLLFMHNDIDVILIKLSQCPVDGMNAEVNIQGKYYGLRQLKDYASNGTLRLNLKNMLKHILVTSKNSILWGDSGKSRFLETVKTLLEESNKQELERNASEWSELCNNALFVNEQPYAGHYIEE